MLRGKMAPSAPGAAELAVEAEGKKSLRDFL